VKFLAYRSQLLKTGIGSKAVPAKSYQVKCFSTQMVNVALVVAIAKTRPKQFVPAVQ
jgi:hypothetical protein